MFGVDWFWEIYQITDLVLRWIYARFYYGSEPKNNESKNWGGGDREVNPVLDC